MPAVPSDFALRLKAARAYGGFKSQAALASAIGSRGAGSSSIKKWESGKTAPRGLTAQAFITTVAELTGISEDFLWGRETETAGIGDQISRLEQQLQEFRAEVAVRDAEVLARIEALEGPSSDSQSGPQR